jgi:hypothetical protein
MSVRGSRQGKSKLELLVSRFSSQKAIILTNKNGNDAAVA